MGKNVDIEGKSNRVYVSFYERSQYERLIAKRLLFLAFCAISLFFLIGLSLSLGSAQISLTEAYLVIFNKLGAGAFEVNEIAERVVIYLRMPRTVMAALSGAVLAISGSTVITVLRNSLATPYTLGVSSAAGFGAAIAIILGRGIIEGGLLIISNAFVLSLIPALVILLFSKKSWVSSETIILTGVAMNYIFSAANTLLQFFAESEAVRATVFWLVGDLARADWWQIPYVLGILVFLFLVNMRLAWDLNVMRIGDVAAKALGVEANKVRRIVLLTACLTTATVVSFTGAIGFIGLLSSHICRIMIGRDERYLIPASGLFGANLLLAADIVARRIMAPIMLPVGAVTAILGGPMLLFLLLRRRES
ncbi:MAG: iron ABC transporter permease [Nitrososphaerales archaeon]